MKLKNDVNHLKMKGNHNLVPSKIKNLRDVNHLKMKGNHNNPTKWLDEIKKGVHNEKAKKKKAKANTRREEEEEAEKADKIYG